MGRTISDYAAEHQADAVVVGSRGLGAFRRRFLGLVRRHQQQGLPNTPSGSLGAWRAWIYIALYCTSADVCMDFIYAAASWAGLVGRQAGSSSRAWSLGRRGGSCDAWCSGGRCSGCSVACVRQAATTTRAQGFTRQPAVAGPPSQRTQRTSFAGWPGLCVRLRGAPRSMHGQVVMGRWGPGRAQERVGAGVGLRAPAWVAEAPPVCQVPASVSRCCQPGALISGHLCLSHPPAVFIHRPAA